MERYFTNCGEDIDPNLVNFFHKPPPNLKENVVVEKYTPKKRGRPATNSKSEINTAPQTTSPPDEQKKKSNCKICQSSKTCERTLCENCLYSYVQRVEADYSCKLCDQKNNQKEIIIDHVDKDHFGRLFAHSQTSKISDPKNIESPSDIDVKKDNDNHITVSQILKKYNFVKPHCLLQWL